MNKPVADSIIESKRQMGVNTSPIKCAILIPMPMFPAPRQPYMNALINDLVLFVFLTCDNMEYPP